ncbi:hypothetical protein KKD19_06490 [Patescibacteria group bacterium]|nr:hypothetical protein [Patescibacteria group bacterium]MBU4512850.1 hypothetical protein [Patescibacteria group bacterium]MCG2693625.1 hypothetical protein [Candidatus Parcubacteria bacterium]
MKNPIIRTIYLYLFSLVGLALLAIGAYRFVDLGLKTWIFTKADQDASSYIARPISLGYDPEFASMQSIKNCEEKCELNEVQIAAIDEWMQNYEEWKENEKEQEKIDYTTQRRQRTASSSLALLIVGLPLYLYHWGLIKRDVKKRKEEEEEEEES